MEHFLLESAPEKKELKTNATNQTSVAQEDTFSNLTLRNIPTNKQLDNKFGWVMNWWEGTKAGALLGVPVAAVVTAANLLFKEHSIFVEMSKFYMNNVPGGETPAQLAEKMEKGFLKNTLTAFKKIGDAKLMSATNIGLLFGESFLLSVLLGKIIGLAEIGNVKNKLKAIRQADQTDKPVEEGMLWWKKESTPEEALQKLKHEELNAKESFKNGVRDGFFMKAIPLLGSLAVGVGALSFLKSFPKESLGEYGLNSIEYMEKTLLHKSLLAKLIVIPLAGGFIASRLIPKMGTKIEEQAKENAKNPDFDNKVTVKTGLAAFLGNPNDD